jgi:multiple sugar transport system permease protein
LPPERDGTLKPLTGPATESALAVTAGNLVFCSMVGYALAKLDFAGKRLLFGLVLGMLMVPGVVTFVPLFVLVANLGLVNTTPA